jgi:hypothetical protein
MMMRALRLAACSLAIGIVLGANMAHAGDDDDDEDESFERQLIDKVMTGIQGRQFDNSGIDYRERSPLVIPPKIDLPPPQAGQADNIPNWPKDPEIAKRKAANAAKRRERLANRDNVADPRVLTPSEVNGDAPRLAPDKQSGYNSRGASDPHVFMPSEYGYKGGIFGGIFKKDEESVKFVAEPPRENLSQPPSGYQTPSPNYAYGVNGKSAGPIRGTERNSADGPLLPNQY